MQSKRLCIQLRGGISFQSNSTLNLFTQSVSAAQKKKTQKCFVHFPVNISISIYHNKRDWSNVNFS